MAPLLFLTVTSSKTLRQIVWSMAESTEMGVETQILLHN